MQFSTSLFVWAFLPIVLALYFSLRHELRNPLLRGPDGPIRLPIVVSFFTFQGTSYLVDIYRRDVGCQKSLINFATYKSFFPQLIAGPIVRYRDVHEQIERRDVSVGGFAYGV